MGNQKTAGAAASRVWNWLVSRYRRQPYEFWMAVGIVVISIPIGWGVLHVDDQLAFVMLILQLLMGTLSFRLAVPAEPGAALRLPVFLFLAVPVTVLVGFWWIGPGLADEESGPIESLFLWALISYASLLLSFLLAIFVAIPLELVGRGLWDFVGGRVGNGIGLISVAMFIFQVPLIGVVGAMAVDVHTVARPAQYAVLMALFGFRGEYTVINPSMLSLARVLFGIFIASLFVIVGLAQQKDEEEKGIVEKSDTKKVVEGKGAEKTAGGDKADEKEAGEEKKG